MIKFSNRMLLGAMIAAMCFSGCKKDEPTPKSSTAPVQSPAMTAPVPESPAAQSPPVTVQSPDVQPSPAPAPQQTLPPVKATVPEADPKVATFAGLTAPKPATWIAHPPARQFSIAEYAVPGREGGDQGRIDVFIAGGSIEANVERWKGQFRSADGARVEPTITQLEANGLPITLVEFAGEYKGMGMVNFAQDQVFLCAILEAPAGQVFIRFVGPRATIESYRADYMNMIQNLKPVEAEK